MIRPRLALRSALACGVLVLPAALLGAAGAAISERYVAAAGSHFTIDGTSTMGAYSCEAGEVAGAADVPTGGPVTAGVTVGVGSFDCGVARMNRDFRRALLAEAHPEIRFTLDRAEVLAAEAHPGAWVPVRAAGRLRLAGTERAVVIEAEGRRLGQGRVRLRGRHPMRMTDFGVDPPSGMLGLVRAQDRIVVRFDLTASNH
jgi:polyisoprenoid-binding protein YceI